MKAADLMIGDWVQGFLPDTFARVCGILNERRVAIITKESGTYIESSIDDIQPIPLTPEILEKIGFTKDEDDKLHESFLLFVPTGYEKNSFTIQITLYKKPICGVTTLFKCWGWIPPLQGGVNDLHICNLVSVHELQHALKLCGIDKIIEL